MNLIVVEILSTLSWKEKHKMLICKGWITKYVTGCGPMTTNAQSPKGSKKKKKKKSRNKRIRRLKGEVGMAG